MQAKVSELPPRRDNLQEIQEDLTLHGVALLADALSPARVQQLSASMDALAAQERHSGSAFLEDGNMGGRGEGPNQRVFGLVGKGAEYGALALEPVALTVAKGLFGSAYGLPEEYVAEAGLDSVLLSSLTANIVGQGGVEMMPHADQAYMPAATPYAGVVNVVWLLSDFTADNGGTRVAPGSHLAENPLQFFMAPPPMVPVEAPAGTALFLDGRTWHATGASSAAIKRTAIFAYYCRPFMRQQENYGLSLSAEQRASFSPELLKLLGFEVWFTLGGIDGVADGTLVS